MSKQAWKAHMEAEGLVTTVNRNGGPEAAEAAKKSLEHMRGCSTCKARKRTFKASRNARERSGVMRSLGLVKTPYGWE